MTGILISPPRRRDRRLERIGLELAKLFAASEGGLIVTAEDDGAQTVARALSASGVTAEAFEADRARGCATRLIPGT